MYVNCLIAMKVKEKGGFLRVLWAGGCMRAYSNLYINISCPNHASFSVLEKLDTMTLLSMLIF